MDRDERLMAFVDGEMDAAARAAFEAEMAGDPALAAQVAAHRALTARLARTYAPVAEEPAPLHLVAAASAANDAGRPRLRRLPQWAAMAACLALGVLVGRAVMPERAPFTVKDGRMTARGELAAALTGKLAADPGLVRVGLSFRGQDGAYCRTFTSARHGLAGLACRDAQDGWRVRTASAWSPAPAGQYRAAASDTPPAVLAAVDATIVGQPLDAAAERSARDQGWR